MIVFAPVGALVPAALSARPQGGSVVCAGIHISDIPSFPYELLWGERVVRSVANLTRPTATSSSRSHRRSRSGPRSSVSRSKTRTRRSTGFAAARSGAAVLRSSGPRSGPSRRAHLDGVVDLQRRVLDPELVVKQALELAPAAVAVLPRCDENVRGQRREAGRDRPDVEVVDLDHAGRASEALARASSASIPRGVDSRRIAVESRRIDHVLARTRTADEDAHERVGLHPARREDHDRRDARRRGSEEIGETCRKAASTLRLSAACAVEDERLRPRSRRCPRSAMTSIHAAEHVGGIAKAHAPPLRRSRSRARRAGRRSRAPRAPRRACSRKVRSGVGGLGGEPGRDEGQRERDVVGEHVHRVGEQREAPGVQAADDLDGRVRGGEDERERRARGGSPCAHGRDREPPLGSTARSRAVVADVASTGGGDRFVRIAAERRTAKATAASPMRLGPASGSSPASSRGRTTK